MRQTNFYNVYKYIHYALMELYTKNNKIHQHWDEIFSFNRKAVNF